uniref:Uncharacterized protein n=1 Tax=Odontella aurita TaxID=265563 RepID=A0A7S4N6Y2_9STRA|mmetsp:Transcript_50297/g.151441  ORF Transcript_50297/g.151441 Transcript_50297/m.151441 type:complete len:129 (+) Transcript_50297:97-483(+)
MSSLYRSLVGPGGLFRSRPSGATHPPNRYAKDSPTGVNVWPDRRRGRSPMHLGRSHLISAGRCMFAVIKATKATTVKEKYYRDEFRAKGGEGDRCNRLPPANFDAKRGLAVSFRASRFDFDSAHILQF